MPHACVKCKQLYPEQSEAILKGCTCGSRIFYFIKSDLPVAKVTLTNDQESEINDASDISSGLIELSKDKPVVIGSDGPENIKVIEQGSYELNVASLFKGDPVIVKTDADVYYVKLPAAPNKKKKR